MASQKKPQSKLRKLLDRLKQLFRPRHEPEDPYAYHMATLHWLPNKGCAAAVAELDEE